MFFMGSDPVVGGFGSVGGDGEVGLGEVLPVERLLGLGGELAAVTNALGHGLETLFLGELAQNLEGLLFDGRLAFNLEGELEVLGAKHVEPFKDFKEMYDAYRDYRKKGIDAWFVIPSYKDSFIMEKQISVRRLGL